MVKRATEPTGRVRYAHEDCWAKTDDLYQAGTRWDDVTAAPARARCAGCGRGFSPDPSRSRSEGEQK